MKLFQKTPLQQYKALKENFCAKYSNGNAWGNAISGKRSGAYNQLIYFLKQSQELVELDEALEEEIYYENVRLLLGNDIRLPNSLKRSMRCSFSIEPFENFTQKFCELMGDLRSDAKSLCNRLRDLSNSCHESDPFPFMKGLPGGDHGDFEEADSYADEVDDEFANYLYENMLSSLYDDPVDSDAESLAESEENSENGLLKDCSEDDLVKVDCNTSFERFSAKLRRLRWKIYQKIAAKNITKFDLDKYELLVGQFINKFGYRELSKSEVFLWKRKFVQTRNDALNAPFDEHLFNDDLSDAYSQELSVVSLDKSDAVNVQKTRAKVDSVKEFFENQKALEDLLEKLPSVPNAEDDELEARWRRLRSFDETDDCKATKVDNPESLEYKVFVKKTMTPMQAKNEIKEEESRTKDPIVKDIKREPADDFDDKTDAMLNETSSTSSDRDAFDANLEFNKWYESELKVKKRKPKSDEVLANAAPSAENQNIYMQKVHENCEYKQQHFPDSNDNPNQDVNKFPDDVLIYSRASFFLLLTICKTLNDQIEKFSTFSHPTFPVTPNTPTQCPMFTSRPLPCSVAMYERTHSCHCEQLVSALATVPAMTRSVGTGVMECYRCTRAQSRLQRVMVGIISFGLREAFTSFP